MVLDRKRGINQERGRIINLQKFRRNGINKESPCCLGHGQLCSDCGYTYEEFKQKRKEVLGE